METIKSPSCFEIEVLTHTLVRYGPVPELLLQERPSRTKPRPRHNYLILRISERLISAELSHFRYSIVIPNTD